MAAPRSSSQRESPEDDQQCHRCGRRSMGVRERAAIVDRRRLRRRRAVSGRVAEVASQALPSLDARGETLGGGRVARIRRAREPRAVAARALGVREIGGAATRLRPARPLAAIVTSGAISRSRARRPARGVGRTGIPAAGLRLRADTRSFPVALAVSSQRAGDACSRPAEHALRREATTRGRRDAVAHARRADVRRGSGAGRAPAMRLPDDGCAFPTPAGQIACGALICARALAADTVDAVSTPAVLITSAVLPVDQRAPPRELRSAAGHACRARWGLAADAVGAGRGSRTVVRRRARPTETRERQALVVLAVVARHTVALRGARYAAHDADAGEPVARLRYVATGASAVAGRRVCLTAVCARGRAAGGRRRRYAARHPIGAEALIAATAARVGAGAWRAAAVRRSRYSYAAAFRSSDVTGLATAAARCVATNAVDA